MVYTHQLLAALLLVSAIAQIDPVEGGRRSLLQNVSASSRTSSTSGTAFARSKATARVFREAETAIADAVATAIANVAGGENAKAEADAAAEAIATAYASIVINVTSTVMANGADVEACANSAGDGEAEATAVARAVASGVANATNKISSATASGFADAVKEATIKVSASAFSEGCTTNGVVEAFENVKAAGYVDAIATAFVEVLAEVSGKEATAESQSGSEALTTEGFDTSAVGGVNIMGQGTGSTGGTANAEVVDACGGDKETCCERGKRDLSRCFCGAMCGMLTKDSDASGIVWIDSDDLKCMC